MQDDVIERAAEMLVDKILEEEDIEEESTTNVEEEDMTQAPITTPRTYEVQLLKQGGAINLEKPRKVTACNVSFASVSDSAGFVVFVAANNAVVASFPCERVYSITELQDYITPLEIDFSQVTNSEEK